MTKYYTIAWQDKDGEYETSMHAFTYDAALRRVKSMNELNPCHCMIELNEQQLIHFVKVISE